MARDPEFTAVDRRGSRSDRKRSPSFRVRNTTGHCKNRAESARRTSAMRGFAVRYAPPHLGRINPVDRPSKVEGDEQLRALLRCTSVCRTPVRHHLGSEESTWSCMKNNGCIRDEAPLMQKLTTLGSKSWPKRRRGVDCDRVSFRRAGRDRGVRPPSNGTQHAKITPCISKRTWNEEAKRSTTPTRVLI